MEADMGTLLSCRIFGIRGEAALSLLPGRTGTKKAASG
ncbi:hypothetical protein ASAP_1767 [Asaia bogorensis]|uniref:Uncharacterized protein n=1 Tax=Asaia bogorensis TaxID=91915 RepID=A0A060QKW5_9PROT|nr:hypothetical protein ASAP_1767 [Asaia bogorensis]